MSDGAAQPFDLRRDGVRRLVAQEFVWRLRSTGSATLEEMRAYPLLLFKIPACPDEITLVADVARRLGWIEPPEAPGGEWRLTDAGRAVQRPPSLAITQVVTRIVSVADPVRTRATDWLPLVALVAGAFTAGVVKASTADAVRWLAAAVLLGSMLWQGYGEVQIVKVVRNWKRVQEETGYRAVTQLYDWPRLTLIVVFDAALVAAFTAAVFGRWWAFVAALGIAAAAGLVHLVWLTWPVHRLAVAVREAPCPDDAAPASAPAVAHDERDHSVRA